MNGGAQEETGTSGKVQSLHDPEPLGLVTGTGRQSTRTGQEDDEVQCSRG